MGILVSEESLKRFTVTLYLIRYFDKLISKAYSMQQESPKDWTVLATIALYESKKKKLWDSIWEEVEK